MSQQISDHRLRAIADMPCAASVGRSCTGGNGCRSCLARGWIVESAASARLARDWKRRATRLEATLREVGKCAYALPDSLAAEVFSALAGDDQ